MAQADYIWKLKYPLLIRIFMWLMAKDATLMIWSKLQHRGWQPPNVCGVCRKTGEGTTYLILTCEFSRAIWTERTVRFGLSFDLENDTNVRQRTGVHNVRSQLPFVGTFGGR